jgi:hypothetical protein
VHGWNYNKRSRKIKLLLYFHNKSL